MLTLMLIDDEYHVTEGLKTSIDWKGHGWTVVATAQNGEEGLATALNIRPDLIITDISMPRMSGLEMAERVRRQLPDTRMIFLTCHEDFHFVKEAMRLRADEYLLKDTMTRQELYAALENAGKAIEETRAAQARTAAISRELSRNQSVISGQIIAELTEGPVQDTEGLRGRLRVYGYELNRPKYILVVVVPDGGFRWSSEKDMPERKRIPAGRILELMTDAMDSAQAGAAFRKTDHEYLLIFNYVPDVKYNVYDKVTALISAMTGRLTALAGQSFTAYVSQPVSHLGEIHGAYASLVRMRQRRFYKEDGLILRSESPEPAYPAMDAAVSGGFVKAFDTAMGELNHDRSMDAVERFFGVVASGRYSVSDVFGVTDRMLLVCIHYLDRNGSRFKQVVQDYVFLHIRQTDSLHALRDAMGQIVRRTLEVLGQEAGLYASPEIRKIVMYIHRHMGEKITLETMAAYVSMNSSYFSRYFKSKTGENFVDFLTRLRVEKARDLLLETDATIDDIALTVGHINKAYFTKVFKKVTGMNPGEFRRKRHA